jgi:uncharacterized protein YndB with AHSA1/START domain
MITKGEILLFILVMFTVTANSQTLKNTSYKNQVGEKVLRLEITLPDNITSVWKFFTTDEKLKKWVAPMAHIELKLGGYMVTNYDSTKSLSDSSSIILPILSYIDNELILFKVNLNNHFSKTAQESDENLQEIIQFIKVDDKHTKIISSMIGWKPGNDWDKIYHFFVKGNEWTYKELLKNYK